MGRLVAAALSVSRNSHCYRLWDSRLLWTGTVCLWSGKSHRMHVEYCNSVTSFVSRDVAWLGKISFLLEPLVLVNSHVHREPVAQASLLRLERWSVCKKESERAYIKNAKLKSSHSRLVQATLFEVQLCFLVTVFWTFRYPSFITNLAAFDEENVELLSLPRDRVNLYGLGWLYCMFSIFSEGDEQGSWGA